MRSISKFSTVSRKVWHLAIGLIMTGMTAHAMAQSIVMSSTTSTEQSGLFGYLLPEFKKATG
ncbi:MAG: tungsten ABC transporter substrate-binding protein, partial [Betaproteobacteria bacterium]